MASSDGNNEKRVTLRSLDGEEFVVDAEIAMQSDTIKNFLDDDEAEAGAGAGDAIPLPNVTGTILAKVIEYCKKHRQEPSKDESGRADEALKSWDAEFLKVSQHTLFDLIMAADYLSIKSLLDFTCQNVADQMRGKTPEAIRAHFHIKNDYTKEEEDAVRRENAWAFD